MKIILLGLVLCLTIPFAVYLLAYLISRAWEMGKLDGIWEFRIKHSVLDKETSNVKKG